MSEASEILMTRPDGEVSESAGEEEEVEEDDCESVLSKEVDRAGVDAEDDEDELRNDF